MKCARRVAIGSIVVGTLVLAASGGGDTPRGSAAAASPPSSAAIGRSDPWASAPDLSQLADTAAPGAALTTSAEGEQPVSGGSLTMLMSLEARTMDPASIGLSPSAGLMQAVAVFDQLVRVDQDGTVHGQLAESLESDETFTVWTLQLRPGLNFTDGTPLNAEAVKYNWERHADPELGSLGAGDAKLMTSIETPNDLTVVVTLASPSPGFPRALMGYIGLIGSPTALEADPEGFGNAPVGAGPFIMTDWVRDSQMVLERNPDYWDSPKPYLDELTFRAITDAAQKADTFLAGDGDMVEFVSASVDVQRLRDQGVEFLTADLFGGQGIWFNQTTAPFDDVRARRAFALALDLEALDDQVTGGASEMLSSIFPESSPFYVGLTQSVNDREAAQQLVDEYVSENGELSFSLVYSPVHELWAPSIAQQLGELDGVSVELELVSDPATRIQQREFDATFGAISGADPVPNINRLMSESSANAGGYANPELDELLTSAGTSGDVAERAELYGQAQQIIFDDVAFLWLFGGIYMTAASDQVHGHQVYNLGEVDLPALWKE